MGGRKERLGEKQKRVAMKSQSKEKRTKRVRGEGIDQSQAKAVSMILCLP